MKKKIISENHENRPVSLEYQKLLHQMRLI
jgi:hypothetical protein